MTNSPEWLQRISAARRQGDHLSAFDLATQALVEHPGEAALEYAAVLALARAGAAGGARARYDRLAASGLFTGLANRTLEEDFAALDGRLWKDLAGRREGEAARRAQLASAAAYGAAFERFGGYYPAINAASMNLAAGETDEARRFARIALPLAAASGPDYWSTVSQAEALLILDDVSGASAKLAETAGAGATQLDELATTRRQLAWVAKLTGAPAEVVQALPSPRVVHWSPAGDFGGDSGAFKLAPPVIAFGPVLSMRDLEVAAMLMDGGAEVNLVMPCDRDAWLASVGAQAGADVALPAVLDRARSVLLVTGEGGPHEPAGRLLCEQQARGLALLRAESLAVKAEALTYGLGSGDPEIVAAPASGILPRQPRAIVFGDVRGFSKLSEASQLDFLEHIIGGFAEVLDASDKVEYAETAGDGLYLVMSDVVSAVECCFALRAVLQPARVAAAGLPGHLALRLSAHVGPLHKRYDRVIRRDKFCGMEVIRTARIEPVTPANEIYVTEQFAAVLACSATGAYQCEYVGLQPMAKGFGVCRMYSLRRMRETVEPS